MQDQFLKSNRLDNVSYEIRGPVYQLASDLENQGYKIAKLNIGNPAPFGFDAPDEIVKDIILNLRNAQGYTDSRGLYSARKAVMQYTQSKGIQGVEVEDVFIGNGVSELILISLQALLNEGDEILIPAPDYPLWTSAVNLSNGKPVHYICDEQSGWQPDLADIESKITHRTKGIVIINPNNPTGAVYDKDLMKGLVQIAERHKLIVFSDEIYDKILYDKTEHHAAASFGCDTLIVTYGGLSKAYRACGFRAGWMVLSGALKASTDYINGLNTLASMRLCSNVPAQYAIQTALGGYQSINDLVLPEGRLARQRDFLYKSLTEIDGISCVLPKGAFYMFPKLDLKKLKIASDLEFVMRLLQEEHILFVQGSGFNWIEPDHFRAVFLPNIEELQEVATKLKSFLTKNLTGQGLIWP